MKVTNKDLTGDVRDFPIEILQWMCDQQVAQGNKFNPEVFQESSSSDKEYGGFDWKITNIGADKCRAIILYRNFDLFFKLFYISNKIKIINKSEFELPEYQTKGSAGLDIRANITKDIEIAPMGRVLIPTGLFVEIPEGYEIQVRPRSGLAIKKGITVLNSPGTIDSDYRGEINVILVNLSYEFQIIEPGDRIAQLVLAKVEKIKWDISEELTDTDRGIGGFGSTGN